VLAQQNDSFRLEYIIVDGGSTDGSLEIIHRFANSLSWWVSEADNGQAEAINKGFRHAHGDIIGWLNSDDLYLPGAVSSAVRALQSDPALGMVFGNAMTIDAQGVPLNRLVFGNWGLAELARFRIICQPAVFIRKTILDRTGYLDTHYHFMLDHHLWLRMASLAPIRHVPESWAAARQHPGAKNVAQAVGFSQETMRLLQWVQKQPEFSGVVNQDTRKIIGGATRLSARYYLDGGLPWDALKAYAMAFWYYPAYTLQHWHRIIYAILCLLGGKNLATWYYRRRPKNDPNEFTGLENWPGICLVKK
jgi:glycosyltransferase involved in cell wall biosynthesis